MLHLFSYCCHCMLCVQGDCSVLEKVVHCQLKGLKLRGDSTVLLPVLSGVKDNRSITDLEVFDGESIITCFYLYAILHRGRYLHVWVGPMYMRKYILYRLARRLPSVGFCYGKSHDSESGPG